MASEWATYPLGEVITLQRGFDLPVQNRRPGSVPIVSSSGISGAHSEAKVDGPGVVTGRYGTIGQVFYIQRDFWPLNTTLFVSDFKGNDPRYISYLLQTVDFESFSDKSSVPGVNRNDIHRLPILLPPLAEQRAIARILSALDDKIELNRRMNATLEAAARALFQSWFVDFDPVRAKAEGRPPAGIDAATAPLFPDAFEQSPLGLIPRGWRVTPLDEIAQFLNGLALQKYPPHGDEWLPVIKIAELRRGNTTDSEKAGAYIDPRYIVRDGDVLFSWSGSLEVALWCGGRGALNQHLFKVTSVDYPMWLCYLWLRHYLPDFQAIAADKATTMGHIQRHHLTNALIIAPPVQTIEAMSQVMRPLLDEVVSNNLQSRTLAATRDTLLPKLLSGEVRVAEAEAEAKADMLKLEALS